MENESYNYIHRVNYYETDKMGITHHSNYVRWMEEARTSFLNHYGFGYAKLEADGIVSPVLSVNCKYKHTTTFDDEIRINIEVEKYTGIKLSFKYVMLNNKTDETVLTATTEHCFLDKKGFPIIVKKRFPELDSILKSLTIEKS
ncbi:MAG: acyl-CoA thioesterase [Clostridia bacterium]|nr:acyl-CoA thioesterase [Clostridia bacterium]